MGLVSRLTDRARHAGMREGLFGDSRGWLGVWVLLTSVRLVRRFLGHKPEVVHRQTLKPGDVLVISHAGTVEAES